MEGFYPNVPSPAAGNGTASWWWDHMAAQANSLRQAGFSAIWIPPVLKGAAGGYSAGYDPFDDYDMGSKNQQGTYTTRFGTREQLERCCAMLRANGLDIVLDIVDNHRAGDDGHYNFNYVDAYGNANSGRFQKGPGDFHWSFSSNDLPEDPNVPDPSADYNFQFGRDLAPINGFKGSDGQGYAYEGLEKSGDWMTKALDCQGYRLDDVKGISTDWLRPFLSYGAMANKYAVGEYYDANIGNVNYWIQTSMQNRVSAFDFALHDQIYSMCNSGGYYDMSQLDHAGLAGTNPGGAVTFVENHDTDGSSPITQNKLLGYALILTSEGYPCVYYKDWSTDPGCYGLKTGIINLMWIHEHLAAGGTQQRYKSTNVFAYERTGGNHLLVGLNDNGSSDQYVYVQTGFYPYTHLHDYTGHKPDVYCDGNGGVQIDIPADNGGLGYVAYAPDAQTGTNVVSNFATTQEYAGAQDLDIKPADNTQLVQVCRVWANVGKPISAALYYDTSNWAANTNIYLELDDPTLVNAASGNYYSNSGQPTSLSITPKRTGWYTFKIRSYNTTSTNLKPAYWLRVTYTAPQK
jgi:alpha-amylase